MRRRVAENPEDVAVNGLLLELLARVGAEDVVETWFSRLETR